MYLPPLLTFLMRLPLTTRTLTRPRTIYFKCQPNPCWAIGLFFVGLMLSNPHSNWQGFPTWTSTLYFPYVIKPNEKFCLYRQWYMFWVWFFLINKLYCNNICGKIKIQFLFIISIIAFPYTMAPSSETLFAT